MESQSRPLDSLTAKAIALVVIVACLALGVIGLILPILPGLLFVVIAAMIAAKLSPNFERTLRQNATLAGYLDKTDGFFELPLGKKIQLVCLLGVKMVMDGLALLVSGIMRLMKVVERA